MLKHCFIFLGMTDAASEDRTRNFLSQIQTPLFTKKPISLGGDLGKLMAIMAFLQNLQNRCGNADADNLKSPNALLRSWRAVVAHLGCLISLQHSATKLSRRHRISDCALSTLSTMLMRPFYDLGARAAFLLHYRNVL